LATLKLQATCPVPSVVESSAMLGVKVRDIPGGGRGGNRVAVERIDVGKVDGAFADVAACLVTEPVSTAGDGCASLLPWIVMGRSGRRMPPCPSLT